MKKRLLLKSGSKKKKRSTSRLDTVSEFKSTLFHEVVNSLGDELMLIRPDGSIAYVNNATVKGLGYSRKLILKKKIYQLFKIKTSFRQWKKHYFLPIKKSKKPLSFRIQRIAKGKRAQIIEVTAVYLPHGDEEYILSVARNITNLVVTHQKLKESQNRYRLLSEGAADGLFTVDIKGRITYANDALENLVNIPIRKSIGRHFKQFVDKGSRSKAMMCFNMAREGQAKVREEITILDNDKNPIEVEVNASPLKKEGKIIGVHAIVRDVRNRKVLEGLVKESEKKYRELFEDSTDALVIFDIDEIILDANRQAERLFQRDKINLIGRHKSWLYPTESAVAYDSIFKKILKGDSKAYDIEIMKRDGATIPASIYGRRIKIGGKNVVLVRFIDLSERIINERKAREMDKMTALGLFVSGTAQEIKHPLQAVLDRTQRLVKDYRNRDFEYIGFKEFNDIINTIQTINNQVRYCCDVTNKLLTLGKQKAGIKKEECDINACIRQSLELFSQQLLLNNIKLALKLASRLPMVAISSVDFDQVINNIMTNALQAMPGGGRITVRTFCKKHEKQVCVEFKDSGVGIPKENLSRILEPFFTTKQTGPGQNVGLGLAVVYSIVKGSNGDFAIKSNLREGTLVRITLPTTERKHKKK